MTQTPGEVADLPDGGPATLVLVKTQIGSVSYPDPDVESPDDARLNMYISAVNDKVRTWPVAERSAGQDAWVGSTVLGAVMLAVRLDARRNSPEGVAAFNSEGPVYVQRNDPDIAMLLDLGDWSKPKVG